MTSDKSQYVPIRKARHIVSTFTDGKRWWMRMRYDGGVHTVSGESEADAWTQLVNSVIYHLTETH